MNAVAAHRASLPPRMGAARRLERSHGARLVRAPRAAAGGGSADVTTDRPIVIVTGGAKGIGAACCEVLAEQGWAVAINHRASSAEVAEALVDKIRSEGGHARAFEADVGVEADVVAMFARAAEWGRLAGLVNNAGVLVGPNGSKTVADADIEDLEAIMRVNVVGPMLCCREAIRHMSNREGAEGNPPPGAGGSIVNISSGSAVIGRPLLYAMSKGALNSFQAGAVDELASHGIRVNAVSPGMTDTDLVADVVPNFDFSKIPLGRIGQPREIAEGVAFLLGEKGSYCSGANIRMSGGRPPGTFLG